MKSSVGTTESTDIPYAGEEMIYFKVGTINVYGNTLAEYFLKN